MLKRVEKRLKRKEREDELGLDEDMKEVLGLNDTDSDESDSDLDSDSHGDIPDADSDNDKVEEEEVDLDEGNDEEDESDNEVDQKSEERALITIAEALTNPIFLVSLDPIVNGCIVCPGKQLKNQKIVETHKSSNAHERRFKQFKSLASNADVKLIAQDFIEKTMSNKQPQLSADPGTSKRAEKKLVLQEKRKAKREKFKARQKAKKGALAHDPSSPTLKESEPSNKAEKFVGKEILEEEGKHVPKNDGGKPKKHKKKDDTASEVLKALQGHSSDPPASPPKKKPKTSMSMGATPIPTTTAAADPNPPSKKLKANPSVPKAETKVPGDDGDKRRKKRKNKNDNTSEILIPSEHAISNPPPSPPKKKRKLSTSTTKPPANQKSKSAPTTAPGPTDESPEVISELQAQVKDIIKSASDLAKAARARALNGGDTGDDSKSLATKKMKKKAVKSKKVQES